MVITYSGKSRKSAELLRGALEDIGVNAQLNRGYTGDINWGRNRSGGLNPDISNVTNKRRMRELFKENNVPMPRLVESPPYPFPIVGRPDQHSKGKGFWKCHNIDEVRQALRGRTYRNGKRKKAATHFMEYIEAPREYRVHIFQGKSIRISEKAFGETGETTTGDYITKRPDPSHNIDHVREAAKKAMEAVELDFGAVDILADNENCWVLEVNAAPHLGGSLPRVYAKKFADWYEEK